MTCQSTCAAQGFAGLNPAANRTMSDLNYIRGETKIVAVSEWICYPGWSSEHGIVDNRMNWKRQQRAYFTTIQLGGHSCAQISLTLGGI